MPQASQGYVLSDRELLDEAEPLAILRDQSNPAGDSIKDRFVAQNLARQGDLSSGLSM